MTLSKGNVEGNGGQQNTEHHSLDEVKRIVDKGVENVAVRAAARIALIVVVPLLGIVISNVISNFENKLDKIAKIQEEQIEAMNKKLDQRGKEMQAISEKINEQDHELQLQLRTIEEILRNTKSWMEETLIPKQPSSPHRLEKNLGKSRKVDDISIPAKTSR